MMIRERIFERLRSMKDSIMQRKGRRWDGNYELRPQHELSPQHRLTHFPYYEPAPQQKMLANFFPMLGLSGS
jgi:hypothetical protein